MVHMNIEALLSEIWSEILDLDTVEGDDDFFELGGDSLQAVDVVYRLRDAGVALKIRDFFVNPTFRELVAVASGAPVNASTA